MLKKIPNNRHAEAFRVRCLRIANDMADDCSNAPEDSAESKQFYRLFLVHSSSDVIPHLEPSVTETEQKRVLLLYLTSDYFSSMEQICNIYNIVRSTFYRRLTSIRQIFNLDCNVKHFKALVARNPTVYSRASLKDVISQVVDDASAGGGVKPYISQLETDLLVTTADLKQKAGIYFAYYRAEHFLIYTQSSNNLYYTIIRLRSNDQSAGRTYGEPYTSEEYSGN